MRKMKRWAALLCAVLMAVTLLPGQVWATETIPISDFSYVTSYSNPSFAKQDESKATFFWGTPSYGYALFSGDEQTENAAGDAVYDTPEAAGAYVRGKLKERSTEITVRHTGIPEDLNELPALTTEEAEAPLTPEEEKSITDNNIPDDQVTDFILLQRRIEKFLLALLDDIMNEAFRHDPKDFTGGDYIRFHCPDIEIELEYEPTENILIFIFTLAYADNAEQEAKVDEAINDILASLELDGKSDYEKIRAIYGWLCQNVTYDYNTLEDDSYLLKYSTYAALVNKTAVCQGYATAFYRMALMAGVNARVVTSEEHAWNIVQLDGLWYHVDSTWDSEVKPDSWQYFLVVNPADKDHLLDEWGANVVSLYPMSPSDYRKLAVKGDVNGNGGVDVTDVAMLYTYLVTGSTSGSALSNEAFLYAADVNGDETVDVYDLQLLYETVCNG